MLAQYQKSELGSIFYNILNPIGLNVYLERSRLDYSRQCKYLQLEKPSGIEIEMPTHERMAINLFKDRVKRDPLGAIEFTPHLR